MFAIKLCHKALMIALYDTIVGHTSLLMLWYFFHLVQGFGNTFAFGCITWPLEGVSFAYPFANCQKTK